MRTLKTHQAGVAENFFVSDADGSDPGRTFKILQLSSACDVKPVSKLDGNSFCNRFTWALSCLVLMDVGKQPNS